VDVLNAVVCITTAREREILGVLRHFTSLAERGQLKGLSVGAKTIDNKEEISIAGVYRTIPAKGVNIAMRMSWRLTQMQDEMELIAAAK
jgi:hypothetical protein